VTPVVVWTTTTGKPILFDRRRELDRSDLYAHPSMKEEEIISAESNISKRIWRNRPRCLLDIWRKARVEADYLIRREVLKTDESS